jgi:hypothetical protein
VKDEKLGKNQIEENDVREEIKKESMQQEL